MPSIRYTAVVTIALLLGLSGSAFAHAFPTTTIPGKGSTVKAAPTTVVINFTEGIIPNFSGIEVVDAKGARIDKNDAHLGSAGAKQFVVDLKPMSTGTYKVLWHATAVDTHKTKGSFSFTVAP